MISMFEIKKLDAFKDNRGAIMFASNSLLDFDYKYLTIGTMMPGSIRGGHYHKRIEEKLACVCGEITIELDDSVYVLYSGDIIDIPTNVVHTLYNTGNELAVFVEFKSEEYDKNDNDTYKRQ